MPDAPRSRQARNVDRRAAAAAAARRLYLRRLSQRRRLGRHQEHARHLDQSCNASRAPWNTRIKRIKAELLPKYPNVDDVVAADPCLWLRRRDQRARCRGADPHPAEPRAQSEFRRRGPGGRPGLREARARAAAAGRRRATASCACRTRPSTASAPSSTAIMTQAEAPAASSQQAHARDLPGVRSRHRACNAAAATPSPASPPIRRSASAADLLVRAGATVMFSEVTEVRDAIQLLDPPRRQRGRRPARWCARWPGMTPISPAAAPTAAPTPRPATRRAALPTSSRSRWARSSSPAPAPSLACCRPARRRGRRACCSPLRRPAISSAAPCSSPPA